MRIVFQCFKLTVLFLIALLAQGCDPIQFASGYREGGYHTWNAPEIVIQPNPLEQPNVRYGDNVGLSAIDSLLLWESR